MSGGLWNYMSGLYWKYVGEISRSTDGRFYEHKRDLKRVHLIDGLVKHNLETN